MKFAPLYPILDVKGATVDIDSLAARAAALAEAGCTAVQLRAKELGAGVFYDAASALVQSLNGCVLVVNDRADVALAARATGVHVGDQDLPPADARRLLGGSAIVGFSTHSVEEAAAADGSVVDYIGFGPVFESPTKAGLREARGVALLERACRAAKVPVVAIGGITLANAEACWAAGAASVAVIGALEAATDPGSLARAFIKKGGTMPRRRLGTAPPKASTND